jgi:hypothetical protein
VLFAVKNFGEIDGACSFGMCCRDEQSDDKKQFIPQASSLLEHDTGSILSHNIITRTETQFGDVVEVLHFVVGISEGLDEVKKTCEMEMLSMRV